ncbi:hypothetical protein M409DRAFT_69933 [Zasmidium cellare ATCC 36951]|uniref:tripeptidyl-peptidase II n=1 Tax=Zasmidium cellare ATCC 36951 TaxID=1080233 RepID=A0A6A6C204_ZASCE|nr:uncharacterized protein M409DRAFT_69933 [Zasmidium cellare ATCC 36951]KAF2161061.1 hypothetical protein M409DRAFT_69933 [Zasmidium cellare ATCC 36951]
MFVSNLLLAIGSFTAVQALPKSNTRSTYAVKERHIVPRSWTRVGSASKHETIHLQIGLKQQNEGQIEEHLLEISDPNHHRHGQHMSAEEIREIIQPSDETQELVRAWLEEHGISHGVHSPSKDFIHVVLPIEKAEELLQTEYSIFEHADGSTISRAPEWSLPMHLHEHIDVVQPTTSFFRPNAKAAGGSGNAPFCAKNGGGAGPISQICNISFTTPDCIRTLYGTYDYKPQAAGKNKIGHNNFLNETSYRKDIYKFLDLFRPEAKQAAYDFKVVQIAGGIDNQGPYAPGSDLNIEANLDSEQILSIGYPTPLTVWSTGGSPPFIPDINTPTDTNEPYLVWLDYVLGQSDLPQVISTSYGDDEQTVPESYARRACSGFAQLGARGISLFFSSGDAGVGGDGTCYSNDGKNTYKFLPNFPTSCPWITSVGGTEAFQPEVAVSRFASGAGFSNYFPQPKYQAAAVSAYIKSLAGLHDGLYNKTGRAYPDVAAQGNHDALVWNNTVRTVGGTSASSPTFAAVISLVNDALIARGKPTLGFLNPWLYGGAYKTLTDVTSGSSYGCNTTGFPAKEGWDAVTGFGTPNFSKLVDAAYAKYGGKGGYPHQGGWHGKAD